MNHALQHGTSVSEGRCARCDGGRDKVRARALEGAAR